MDSNLLFNSIFKDVTADYSDHALWWPEKKIWLTKARLSLASYGITNDVQLLFTPQHKSIRLQLPDLQRIDIRVNFAIDVFHSVAELCTELGIRHPEELSFLKPFETGTGKKRRKSTKPAGSANLSDETGSQGSLGNGTLGRPSLTSPSTLKTPSSPISQKSYGKGGSDHSFSGNDSLNPYSTALSPMLTHSPTTVSSDQLEALGQGKSLVERAVFNTG